MSLSDFSLSLSVTSEDDSSLDNAEAWILVPDVYGAVTDNVIYTCHLLITYFLLFTQNTSTSLSVSLSLHEETTILWIRVTARPKQWFIRGRIGLFEQVQNCFFP
jgi:hypothetical protein